MGGIACVRAQRGKFRERSGLDRCHRDRDYHVSTHAFLRRMCKQHRSYHGVVYVKTYHIQRTPSKNQLGSIQSNVDCGWRTSQLPSVSLFQFSYDTCCMVSNFIWITLPRPLVGYFGHGRVRWCSHLKGVHGCTYSKQVDTTMFFFFFAQHNIGNILK